MNTQQFAELVVKHGFKLLPKRFTPRGNILMAERYRNFDVKALPEVPGPHWQILWSIERDDVKTGQTLYFKFGHDGGQAGRIGAAVARAKMIMADMDYVASPEGQADGARP